MISPDIVSLSSPAAFAGGLCSFTVSPALIPLHSHESRDEMHFSREHASALCSNDKIEKTLQLHNVITSWNWRTRTWCSLFSRCKCEHHTSKRMLASTWCRYSSCTKSYCHQRVTANTGCVRCVVGWRSKPFASADRHSGKFHKLYVRSHENVRYVLAASLVCILRTSELPDFGVTCAVCTGKWLGACESRQTMMLMSIDNALSFN